MDIPYLFTNNSKINLAYRMAIGTFVANIQPFQDGILEEEEPVIIAGYRYDTPWTRDAAINTWNCGGMICPDVALNTLKSVMGKNEKGYFIDGQYWDAVIWVTGAWSYYLYTGDMEFLEMAYEASVNSLAHFEETEYSDDLKLFRGPACYGDGVSAYPDLYASHKRSDILSFAEKRREYCVDRGVGIPMYALSTNCLYYGAYVIADKMAELLGKEKAYGEKAQILKAAINQVFWNDNRASYDYLSDPYGGSDYQEGLGLAFSILYGVADKEKIEKIFQNVQITPHGIACVWPSFSRYDTPDEMGFGRHSGTVWPHVQGFWADAAARCGNIAFFEKEFLYQTDNALNSNQFAEIYHPLTGEAYGGRQEREGGIIGEWDSGAYQTWSATAYLRNVYMNLLGMRFDVDGVRFDPVKTDLVTDIKLTNFKYRDSVLNISVRRTQGSGSFKVNGVETVPYIPKDIKGINSIEILLSVNS